MNQSDFIFFTLLFVLLSNFALTQDEYYVFHKNVGQKAQEEDIYCLSQTNNSTVYSTFDYDNVCTTINCGNSANE